MTNERLKSGDHCQRNGEDFDWLIRKMVIDGWMFWSVRKKGKISKKLKILIILFLSMQRKKFEPIHEEL